MIPGANGSEVSEDDELRRAIHHTQLDDDGEPTSAAFKSINLSLDVASLCSLEETRRRFRLKSVAVLRCRSFRELSYAPLHNPLPDNPAHAIVPGKIRDSAARKLSAAVLTLLDPIDRR